MIRKSDVQWWVLEAKKHPESAPAIIKELAKRLVELDTENEHLREKIIRLQRRAPAALPSDEVKALQRRVESLQSLLDSKESVEAYVVFLFDRLQSARVPLSQARVPLSQAQVPLSQAREMARQGRPVLDKRALLGLRCLLLARPHDELLLLTSQGRGLKVQLSDICLLTDGGGWPFDPSTEHRPGTGLRTGRAPGLLEPGALYRTVQYGAQGPRAQAQGPLVLRHCTERPSTVPKDEGLRAQDRPTTEGQGLASGERLTAAVAVAKPPRFWTIATRRGYVQRFVRVAFDRGLTQGDRLVKSPLRNDEPVAIVNGDRGDLLLITRWGKGVRFSHRAIEGQGSVALNLDPDDEVVAALSLPSDAEILIVTASGYVMRRHTSQFAARSRPGGAGRTLIQTHDVLAAFPYSAQARLLYLTYSGKLAFVSTVDVPLQERAGKGTLLRDVSLDPAVAVAYVAKDLLYTRVK